MTLKQILILCASIYVIFCTERIISKLGNEDTLSVVNDLRNDYNSKIRILQEKQLQHEKTYLFNIATIRGASPEQLDSLESMYTTQFDVRRRVQGVHQNGTD